MRYLLGTLSEDEKRALEERFFNDDDEFEELEVVEDELIDRYVNDELDQGEKRSFERAIALSPRLRERVVFARMLAGKVAAANAKHVEAAVPGIVDISSAQAKQPWLQRPVLRAALAAVLAVVLFSSIVFISRKVREARRMEAQRIEAEKKQELERQAAESQREKDQRAVVEKPTEQAPPQPTPSVEKETGATIALLTLSAGSTRGSGRGNQITLNSNTSQVRLTLHLVDAESRTYKLTIATPEGTVVYKQERLTAEKRGPAQTLAVQFPAKRLSAGDYLVTVEGTTVAGTSERVANYSFHVNKRS